MHLLDQIYSILCLQIEVATIQKAINSVEEPVKYKHVRSAIISTFQGEYGQTFWTAVSKLPVMENKIVAWKLCYLVHKILREGHPLCLYYSQRHVKDLEEMGKFWSNVKDDYGKMIKFYTDLLLTKLDFHKRNPLFSGSIDITSDQLDILGSKDLNIYFQLVIELMDYLDKILDLQKVIFDSLDLSKSNSTTKIGQCKLTPLMPCIQDASRLYNYIIKLLFKLHEELPMDELQGHRNRFFKQYRQLRNFYEHSKTLQYFKNLISVPFLPQEPPDFIIFSETHVSLITETSINDETSFASSSSDSLIKNERENLIKCLQDNSEYLRTEIQHMVSQHLEEVNQLKQKIQYLQEQHVKREDKHLREDHISNNYLKKKNEVQDLIEYYKLREYYIHLLTQDKGGQCEDVKSKLKNVLKENFYKNNNKFTHIADVNKYLEALLKKEVLQLLTEDIKVSFNISNFDSKIFNFVDFNANIVEMRTACMKNVEILKNNNNIGFYNNILAIFNIFNSFFQYILFIRLHIKLTCVDQALKRDFDKSCTILINKITEILYKLHETKILPDDVMQIENYLNELSEHAASNYCLGKNNQNDIINMDISVKEACKRMEQILNEPKCDASVGGAIFNEKICNSCTHLIDEINLLIEKSKFLQAEVVSQGKTGKSKAFYKQNNQWSDGFISAAKAIADSVIFFVNTAENIVSNNGKIEELIVAAQEIAATTVQLIVASKVKADVASQNLLELIQISRKVIVATNGVISMVKELTRCENTSPDKTDSQEITLHEAKMKEIEIQVKILELEKNLQDERQKLAALRKQQYKMQEKNNIL